VAIYDRESYNEDCFTSFAMTHFHVSSAVSFIDYPVPKSGSAARADKDAT